MAIAIDSLKRSRLSILLVSRTEPLMSRKFATSTGSPAEISNADIALVVVTLTSLFGLSIYLFGFPLTQLRTASRLRTFLASQRNGKSTAPFYSTAAAYSRQRALNTFAHYDLLSRSITSTYWFSLNELSPRHKALSEAIGYDAKLKRLAWAERKNALLTQGIARFVETEYDMKPGSSTESDFHRATEALKHFVRDWSHEGRAERERTHGPILQTLRRYAPSEKRSGIKVLVPGCGFDVNANEYSHYMTLPLRYLCSNATTLPNQHRIYPYHFSLSHNRETADLFRPASFPDAIPRLGPSFKLTEGDFLAITSGGYDIVVTMFFIDTAFNVIDYLRQIHDVLKPGGIWINLGPLLWTSGSGATLRLSVEELLALAKLVGFDVQEESRRRIDTEYTSNTRGMMRWIYETEFWTATKHGADKMDVR
ncbi:hypothetical protein FRB97_007710 [Tulasnella sp. 331]|nr:hypothetical protein FRB97_007710 [Tulasnella sp. 331]KAG8880475.1 hypothetical protein FRB98_005060 [Tulasnella sp. 332]